MKNKSIVSKLFTIVLFSLISIIFCENCNALENKSIQTIDNVALPENRLVISKKDATNVDIQVDNTSEHEYTIDKDIRSPKCASPSPLTMNGDKCVHWAFLSKTAHLISISNVALNTAKIKIVYDKVGTYDGKSVGVALTISHMEPSVPSEHPTMYLTVSDSLYDGYLFYWMKSFKYSYDFFYTDDLGRKPISLKDAYISINSLNYDTTVGDESIYFDSQQLNSITKVLATSDTHIHASTNLHNGKYAFGVTPGPGEFEDKLGAATFTRNSATFEVNGSFGYYVDADGTNPAFGWRSISSATITPDDKVPTPEKPRKTIADNNNHESTEVYYKSGEEYTFVIRQKVHNLGVNILTRYKSFVIKDALPSQVEYIEAKMYDQDNNLLSNGTINYDTSSHTVTWTANNNFLTTMPLEGETYTLKIKVRVKNGINQKFTNKSTTLINNTSVDSNIVTLHTPTKAYASDTPYGKNGSVVRKGNKIKYSIKYGNASDNKTTITIKDTISKGLKYVNNSAKVGNTFVNPSVTKNSDGTTTLIWTREVNAGVNEELTYTVLVTGGVDRVKNSATVKYDNDPEIQLPELVNPLVTDYNIPNTASTIAITGVLLGIALIGGGGYLIYKKYKKA